MRLNLSRVDPALFLVLPGTQRCLAALTSLGEGAIHPATLYRALPAADLSPDLSVSRGAAPAQAAMDLTCSLRVDIYTKNNGAIE